MFQAHLPLDRMTGSSATTGPRRAIENNKRYILWNDEERNQKEKFLLPLFILTRLTLKQFAPNLIGKKIRLAT